MVQDKVVAMASLPRNAPSELYCYEPPPSLWALVQLYVPDHEREEVKFVLGESLIEQSLELHQEVELLLDIWREYREETEEKLMHTRLPEPPAARERLKQEIKFFVENIRDKAKSNGRNPADALERHNSVVLDYVLNEDRPDSGSQSSRPSTARSGRDGRDTPMVLGTPSSLASNVSEEVASVSDKLNAVNIDEVTQHLRETLEEEISHLMKDIDFLQHCLDDEADYRCQSSMGGLEPTLTDLREERTKLEKTMLSDEQPVPEVLRKKSSLVRPHFGANKVIPELQVPSSPPSGQKLRPTPPSSASGVKPGRPQPMKANHQISTAQVLSLDREDSSDSILSNSSTLSQRTDCSSVTHSRLRSNSAGRRVDSASSISTLTRHKAASPSHITIKMGDQPGRGGAKVVKVGSIAAPSKDPSPHTPSPPTSGRPPSVRPNSASRFRKMVLQSRDGQ